MAMLRSNRIPSPRETSVAVGVLLVLVAVATWIAWTQARFSPAVIATLQSASADSANTATPSAADLMQPWPAEVRPMSAAESFSPATLSDKIDGKAELYLAAGFTALRCQRVVCVDAPASWLEVFFYEMAGPEQAFAVYSSQKRHAVSDLELGDHGYAAGNQVCFVHGKFYGEIVGADERPATQAAAITIARAIVGANAVAPHAEVGADATLFPSDGMIAGSTMLLSTDVFGFDQLKNVFVARYRDADGDLTLFLGRRTDATIASALARSVRAFFINDCGGKDAGALASVPGATVVDLGGTFEVVFATGPFVAGVHEAPTRDAAARAAGRLHAALSAKQ